MKSKILLICVLILSFFQLAFSLDQQIYNPFQSKYRYSMLDFNRFQLYNQISFFSVFNNKTSYSTGMYLSTLQYTISPTLNSYLHIGKQYNFSSSDNLPFKSQNNFLSGATVIYTPTSTLNIGLEYGTTPRFLNNFYGIVPDKSLHLWVKKEFGKNINLKVEYYQIKP